ncbi:MAG: hypothetical protein MJK04_14580 [Psychrosphaera sp.]|nr:hypothetical protein [Psychrosphaera sp.]
MKNNKLKKTLLAMGLGLGLSLSGNASAIDNLCVHFTNMCSSGNSYGCELMRRYC